MKDKVYYKDGTIFEGEWDDAPHHKDSSNILHREDGPAVEYADGSRYWYLNGEYLKILTKKYLIRYMKLTKETLTTLLLHPEVVVRDSVKKYKWN